MGRTLFALVRYLPLCVRAPDVVAINRTFQKVQRPGGKDQLWIPTIAQREFCFHAGDMTLATELPGDETAVDALRRAFTAINYFGRRGGFFQWMGDDLRDEAPARAAEFVDLTRRDGRTPDMLLAPGFLQRMDDIVSEASFDDVSIWNPRAKGGRRSYTVVIPYTLMRHGAGYTIYERR
ncbi:MAG: hypothetical protein GYB68_15250 [Chloroflexi bacterium]|nr:hypothetical protein [Chloroflexota bacterium]